MTSPEIIVRVIDLLYHRGASTVTRLRHITHFAISRGEFLKALRWLEKRGVVTSSFDRSCGEEAWRLRR